MGLTFRPSCDEAPYSNTSMLNIVYMATAPCTADVQLHVTTDRRPRRHYNMPVPPHLANGQPPLTQGS